MTGLAWSACSSEVQSGPFCSVCPANEIGSSEPDWYQDSMGVCEQCLDPVYINVLQLFGVSLAIVAFLVLLYCVDLYVQVTTKIDACLPHALLCTFPIRCDTQCVPIRHPHPLIYTI